MSYHYRISRRAVAARFVLWIAVMDAVLGGLYWWGVPLDSELMQWGTIGVAVVSVALLASAVWNWRNPATYELSVSSDRLRVHYPGQPAWSFDVPVGEISHIENRFERSHAGKRHDGHWVVMKNGDAHRITTNYFTSIRRVHRALQAANPEIGYETVIR